jgi:hypothetical protein
MQSSSQETVIEESEKSNKKLKKILEQCDVSVNEVRRIESKSM